MSLQPPYYLSRRNIPHKHQLVPSARRELGIIMRSAMSIVSHNLAVPTYTMEAEELAHMSRASTSRP
jgi:hypothetical protein